MRQPTLRFSGVFDFDGMYKMMYNWFFKQRYEFHETLYKDKVSTPLGTELELKWRAEKKITEFHKFIIEIDAHLWDMADVEVIKNGKKQTLTRCRMQLIYKGTLEVDYADKFKESDFTKRLFKFLEKKVINQEIEFLYIDRLTYIIYELHAETKKFLGMDTASNAWPG